MPLEMDDEKSEAKSGHYQYYFYNKPTSEAEDMSSGVENKPAVAQHQFPNFSPRLYFLILIPPYEFHTMYNIFLLSKFFFILE